MACSAASESDAERSQCQPSTNILVLPERRVTRLCARMIRRISGAFPWGDVPDHALMAARSNRNAEQPRGVGAENRVLLLLPDFLGAADIFDRPLFRKRIVGGQHDMARGDLGHQELPQSGLNSTVSETN